MTLFLVFTASAGLFGRRDPAPLFPDPIVRIELTDVVTAADALTDCPDAPITRGQPVPVACKACGASASMTARRRAVRFRAMDHAFRE